MRKIFDYFWSVRKQFTNYFITGISGTVLDIGTLYLLTMVWQVRPVYAVMLNGLLTFCYIFLLNKYWTFKATGMTHLQVIRFLLVYAGNYLFAITWMWFFTEVLNLKSTFANVWILLEVYYNLIVRIVNIAMSICWNFLIYKYFVYKIEPGLPNNHGSVITN